MFKKNDLAFFKPNTSIEIPVKILIIKDNFALFGKLPLEPYDYYVRDEKKGQQFFVFERDLIEISNK